VVEQRRSSLRPQSRFVEPPWGEPLDAERELLAMPESVRVRGLLIAPMIAETKRQGITRAAPRDRYVTFNWYPLREHARILIDYCHDVYPDLPIRSALRKVGRASHAAFGGTTLGKVTLGTAEGVFDVVTAFAKAYELSMEPGKASVVEQGQKHMVVHLEEIHHFLDSHHVGAFEGALKRAGLRGRVTIAMHAPASADFLLEW
jgi:uncharacterized protein (TIGR02265 family)